jgi:membrane-bound lytic murein transglycosylase A
MILVMIAGSLPSVDARRAFNPWQSSATMAPFPSKPAAAVKGFALMMLPFTSRSWGLALALPLTALLTACDGAKQPQAPKAPPHTTYTTADWKALPAVSDVDLQAGFASWRSACQRLKADAVWGATCAAAGGLAPAPEAAQIRAFLQERLQVYSLRADGGSPDGLITGYYEPVYPGSLTRTDTANVPVYGVPDDLIVVNLDSIYPELKGKRLRGRLEGRVLKPYDDAATIGANGLDAPVIAWLTDPMDLQFLQIQGSGRVSLADGSQLRLGYADQNGRPYRAIGRWLVEQGELKKEDVTMGSIAAWAKAHPQRIPELLASNPSYVFFGRNPDSNEGPRGSLNVPLTAGYSVAIDRKVIPLGSLLWLSTTRPDGSSLVRPVAAQDTGGAIAGEVRADLFWGTGDEAGKLAGDMKQKGNVWLLWPKGMALPDAASGTSTSR